MATDSTTAVLTVVSAWLDPAHDEAVRDGFAELVRQPKPDGLLRTELLTDGQGWWHIHTLWRDQAALQAMRKGADPPAAPALFRGLGGEPSLQILLRQAAFPTSAV